MLLVHIAASIVLFILAVLHLLSEWRRIDAENLSDARVLPLALGYGFTIACLFL
jgi:hypothetical protein